MESRVIFRRWAPAVPCARLVALAATVGALLALASPAGAAPDPGPVRFWSVSKLVWGTGEVPVGDGAQVGGKLQQYATVGRVVFNLPLHAPYWYFLPGTMRSEPYPRAPTARVTRYWHRRPLRARTRSGRVRRTARSRTWTSTRHTSSRTSAPPCASRCQTSCSRQSTTPTAPQGRFNATSLVPAAPCAPWFDSTHAPTPRRPTVTSSTPAALPTSRDISILGRPVPRPRRIPRVRYGVSRTSRSTGTPTTVGPARRESCSPTGRSG